MKITVQLSTEKSFGSWLIRYGTNSDFSHVDLVLPDSTLLGARMDGGVKIRPADYAKFDKVARFYADVPDDVGKRILDFAHSQIGKPYDKTGIVNFFIQNRNWREQDSFFCSELIAWVFEQAGWPLFNPFVQVSRITPRDLTLSLRLEIDGKKL